MYKRRRSQARNQPSEERGLPSIERGLPSEVRGLPAESQPPDRWKVHVEGEPAAGCSPAEAGLSEEHHGPPAPFQAGDGSLPASCPIAPRVSQVINLSFDLQRAMRRLRRELNACQACPVGESCRFMSYFQEQVNAAITQVNEEWGMP